MKGLAGLRLSAAVLAGALVLSACSQDKAVRPCPPVRILKDAERAVLFRPGAGRDITDIRYEVAVTGVSSECRYKGSQLVSSVKIDIVAGRGPAADANAASFPFFVAVVDREQNILNKQVFDSRIEFPNGQRRAGAREEIDQIVQVPQGLEGDDYAVLVGLQLDEPQLEYNRAQQQR